MTCVDTTLEGGGPQFNLAAVLGPVLAFGVLVIIGLVIALLYWRKLIADLEQAQVSH